MIGSGIAAERLSPGDVGLQLLENSTATVLVALVALILTFGSVSGAHLNPVVTLAEAVRRHDRTPGRWLPTSRPRSSAAALGAMVANLMFELPAVDWSTDDRVTAAHLPRRGRGHLRAADRDLRGRALRAHWPPSRSRWRGYIGAAYWFTSSTSFANPAVTVGPHALGHLRRHRAGVRARRSSAPSSWAAPSRVATALILFPEPEPSLQEALDA